MEADTTSEPNSSNNSTNGSNGDYEFISNESFGSPIQIVKVSEERKFELDFDALSSILLRDSIRDTPVVVVSIAGDFRKGFLLISSLILFYLLFSLFIGFCQFLEINSLLFISFSVVLMKS